MSFTIDKTDQFEVETLEFVLPVRLGDRPVEALSWPPPD
jgi:hypothetical protein